MKAGAVVPAAGGGELGLDDRLALAETSKDPDVLVALARDKDSRVRGRVAGNPNAPATAFEMLAGDGVSDVRWWVAGNLNAPAAVLETLVRDRDSDVRGRVATNPNAPAAALEVLAGNESLGVRRWVVGNPNTPTSVVAELMGDPIPYVASAARSRFASWAQETLDLGSVPTGQFLDMLVVLRAWELDPKDPAVTAAIVLCN